MINEDDLLRFRDILSGTGALRPAITHAYDYVDVPGGLTPTYEYKREHSFAPNLDAYSEHAEMLNSKLQPGELGFLATPEYFFSTRKGRQHDPVDRQTFKKAMSNLSEKYPNIMFAPTGFYHKKVDGNDYYRRTKFERQMEEMGDRFLTPSRDLTENNPDIYGVYQNFGRQTPEEQQNILSGAPHIPTGNPNVDQLYEGVPWNKIKNQRDFYWKGTKVGSYKKRTYYNEIPQSSFNEFHRGLQLGDGRIKPAYAKDELKYMIPNHPQNQLADTLAENFDTRTCYDNYCYPNIPAPPYIPNYKKLSLLGSDYVGFSKSDPAFLAMLADTKGLNQFDDDPAYMNFAGHPRSDTAANFRQETTAPYAITPNNGLPLRPMANPYFWPLTTMTPDAANPATGPRTYNMHPLDTTNPVFYNKNSKYLKRTSRWMESLDAVRPRSVPPGFFSPNIERKAPTHSFFNFQSYQFPKDPYLQPPYKAPPAVKPLQEVAPFSLDDSYFS